MVMDFSDALDALKYDGYKISRKGWNGKGMHVELIEGGHVEDKFNKIFEIEPFFIIKNVKGTFNTWVPSVSDILADDWEIVN